LNRRIGIGILLALIGIGVIVIGFLVLGSFIRQTLAPPPAPTPITLITQKVVVTTHDIPLGALLQQEDLVLIDVPVELAPRSALTDVKTAIGRISKVPMVTGELVLDHHLADPTNVSHDLAFTLGENTVLVAFPADDLISGLDVVQRGDVIDLFVSAQEEISPNNQSLNPQGNAPETISRLFTFDALQRVGVTAIVVDILNQNTNEGTLPGANVGQDVAVTQATPQPKDIRVRGYLLALTPQDALVLKHLRDIGGKFDIALRNPTSTELYQLNPVLMEYIIDKYQLNVNPNP
jgi:pilus assembly protein CpaB